MGDLPFKLFLEARPVRFLKVESSPERNSGWANCSIDCKANGAVLGFCQGLQYQLLAQSRDVVADKRNVRVVAGFPSAAIKGLSLFGFMDQVELVGFGPCFNCISIIVVSVVSPL